MLSRSLPGNLQHRGTTSAVYLMADSPDMQDGNCLHCSSLSCELLWLTMIDCADDPFGEVEGAQLPVLAFGRPVSSVPLSSLGLGSVPGPGSAGPASVGAGSIGVHSRRMPRFEAASVPASGAASAPLGGRSSSFVYLFVALLATSAESPSVRCFASVPLFSWRLLPACSPRMAKSRNARAKQWTSCQSNTSSCE